MAKIKEIFTSVQGEGPYVGYKQLFIRFCGCNLSCKYCDTNFSPIGAKEYSAEELSELCNQHSDCHSVSLTGGEPLLNVEFLKDFLPNLTLPIYLETNGTMATELNEVIDYIQYIATDIKLPSVTGLKPLWSEHEEFLKLCRGKEVFAKVVFDENITEYEICKTAMLCKKYDFELILQPKMDGQNLTVFSDFIQSTLDKFLEYYTRVRVIPQTHKFLNID